MKKNMDEIKREIEKEICLLRLGHECGEENLCDVCRLINGLDGCDDIFYLRVLSHIYSLAEEKYLEKIIRKSLYEG